MKKYFQIGILLMGFTFAHSTLISAQCPIKERIMGNDEEDENTSEANNRLIIYYDKSEGNKALMRAIEKKGCTIMYNYKNFSGVAIKLPKDWDIDKAIVYFKKIKGVTTVNKDNTYQLQ